MNFLSRRLTYKLTCPVCNSTQSWWLGLLGPTMPDWYGPRYKWNCHNCGTLLALSYVAKLAFLLVAIIVAVIISSFTDIVQWNRFNDCSRLTIGLFLFSIWVTWSVFLTFFIYSFGAKLIPETSRFKKKSWSQDILISDRVFALKFGLLKATIFMWLIILSFLLVIAVPLCLIGSAVLNY